jgi:hypothetical protein
MLACESCHRHYRIADGTCPFCRRATSSSALMALIGGAVTTVVLAACYGGVPTDTADKDSVPGDTGSTADTSPPDTTPP